MPDLVIAIDGQGALGAFSSVGQARAALAGYPDAPVALQAWRCETPPEPGGAAWALPYKSHAGLAAASTDRGAVEEAQARLAPVGLVEEDSIDYWEMVVDKIQPPALARLAAVQAGVEASALGLRPRNAGSEAPPPPEPVEKNGEGRPGAVGGCAGLVLRTSTYYPARAAATSG